MEKSPKGPERKKTAAKVNPAPSRAPGPGQLSAEERVRAVNEKRRKTDKRLRGE